MSYSHSSLVAHIFLQMTGNFQRYGNYRENFDRKQKSWNIVQTTRTIITWWYCSNVITQKWKAHNRNIWQISSVSIKTHYHFFWYWWFLILSIILTRKKRKRSDESTFVSAIFLSYIYNISVYLGICCIWWIWLDT